MTAGLVAAVLSMCNPQGQCETHSLYIQKHACTWTATAYRADVGRGTVRVRCPK